MYNNDKIITSANKSKAAWDIIRKSTSNKITGEEIKLNINGTVITDKNSISNTFNKYFNEIPSDLSKNIIKDEGFEILSKIERNPKSIFLSAVTENEIMNIVKSLKNSNAAGVDEINTNLLKQIIENISQPLTYLINQSFLEGTFPDKLKLAKIVPIHKKGPKDKIENYRPISLLASISKIFEKAMLDRLISFLTKFNILTPEQFGFRKYLSTNTAIIDFLSALYLEMDASKCTMGLFLDMSKAFDLVDYKILLSKLDCYGIRGQALKWIESFLVERKHLVDIGGNKSDCLDLCMGVPQGSVLGPLLFIIYINDFPKHLLNSKATLFADDTSILSSDKSRASLVHKMNTEIEHIDCYYRNNNLLINISKSNIMKFSCHEENESLYVKLEGKSLEQQEHVKFLGVYIDCHLKWDKHINVLCSRLSTMCYVIRQLSSIVDSFAIRMYYFSNFQSALRYGVISWGSATDASRAFILQKRAVRCIAGARYMDTCKPLFIRLQILSFPSIFIMELLIFAKTNYVYLTKNRDNNTSVFTTRHANDLAIPKHKLSLYKSSPEYLATICYNKLPRSIKNLTLNRYKFAIQNILLQKSYYSLNEFLEDKLLE